MALAHLSFWPAKLLAHPRPVNSVTFLQSAVPSPPFPIAASTMHRLPFTSRAPSRRAVTSSSFPPPNHHWSVTSSLWKPLKPKTLTSSTGRSRWPPSRPLSSPPPPYKLCSRARPVVPASILLPKSLHPRLRRPHRCEFLFFIDPPQPPWHRVLPPVSFAPLHSPFPSSRGEDPCP
jgi:hypothetical protein